MSTKHEWKILYIRLGACAEMMELEDQGWEIFKAGWSGTNFEIICRRPR